MSTIPDDELTPEEEAALLVGDGFTPDEFEDPDQSADDLGTDQDDLDDDDEEAI